MKTVAVANAQDIRPDIHTLLIKNNSSVEKIVIKLLPSLDANRDIKDRYGDVIETVPDWNVRIKGGTLLLTALGYMKSSDTNVNTVIQLSEETRRVEEMFERHSMGG
jgi:hypothetical protein